MGAIKTTLLIICVALLVFIISSAGAYHLEHSEEEFCENLGFDNHSIEINKSITGTYTFSCSNEEENKEYYTWRDLFGI
jgi:hypothetical protein